MKIGMFDETLELVEDVAPALLLKRKGYRFIFENKALWLHREPAKLFPYLRRKFRGGIGMSLLEKKKLKKNIVPKKILVGIAILFLVSIIFALISRKILVVGGFAMVIGAFLIRWPAFKINRNLSNESVLFIIFSIYLEYLWWLSTFCGYLYGKRMSADQINYYLKGR